MNVTPNALDRIERTLRERIDTLETLHTARMDNADEALGLQAKEYERRLFDLNHAHRLAQEAQAKTVPRETFDDYRETQATALEARNKEQRTWQDGVNSQLSASVATAKTWSAAIGILLILISLAIRFIQP